MPKVAGSFRGFWFLITTAFRTSPGLALMAVIFTPLALGSTQLNALWLKLLTDGVIEREMTTALVAAGLLAASQGFLAFQYGAYGRTVLTLGERIGYQFDRMVTELTARAPGLEHHELPEYLDKIELLRQDKGTLGGAMNIFSQFVAWAAMWVFTVVLLFFVHPLLLLLLIGAVPHLVVTSASQKRTRLLQEDTAEDYRLSQQIFSLATTPEAGKEFRVFNLRDEMLHRHESIWRRTHKKTIRLQRFITLLSSVATLLSTSATLGAIAFVVWRAARGLSTPGQVIMTVILSRELTNYTLNLVNNIGWFVGAFRAVGRLLWLKDYSENASRGPLKPIAVPSRIEQGLKLQDVSFRYPGTEPWVLKDLNLIIPAGAVVALVGENGAGKTSLIKLVCRFYAPTEGSITVDGTDITSFHHEEWRNHLATGFQDFVQFELLARESVGVGDLPRIEDHSAVAKALDRAGGPEIPTRLEEGLETQLGRDWEGGVELSTGQWQKLALGRALMRETPLLLILDEPTASLDAETEYKLFERFAQAARKANERGSITLLVSHRFSTVRMADLIVVLEEGRIIDVGSHQELMGRGGLYAELYDIQAKAYR